MKNVSPILFLLLVRRGFVPVSGFELLTFHLQAADFSPLSRCVLLSVCPLVNSFK